MREREREREMGGVGAGDSERHAPVYYVVEYERGERSNLKAYGYMWLLRWRGNRLIAQVTDSSVVPLCVHDHFLRVVLKLSQNSDSLCNWLEGSGCQVFCEGICYCIRVFPP